MGLLINGQWHTNKEMIAAEKNGRFIRKESVFRNWIKKHPVETSNEFWGEKNRYHLYVSLACPWAHRTLITRALKGLEDIVSLSVVHPYMGENEWTFDEFEGTIADSENHAKYLYEIYLKADPSYTGPVTVPVLWDKKTKTIVNNESSEIIRMFNDAFDEVGAQAGDYYPVALQEEINKMNDFIYPNINNGVYKTGFATKQEVYEEEVLNLFNSLEYLDSYLENKDFLVGNTLTEADIRLFTTLVRFDSVYFGHFKCNLKQLVDFKNLWLYTRKLYQIDAFKSTTNFAHIKNHYYQSHPSINPNRIVPYGPIIDWTI